MNINLFSALKGGDSVLISIAPPFKAENEFICCFWGFNPYSIQNICLNTIFITRLLNLWIIQDKTLRIWFKWTFLKSTALDNLPPPNRIILILFRLGTWNLRNDWFLACFLCEKTGDIYILYILKVKTPKYSLFICSIWPKFAVLYYNGIIVYSVIVCW